MRGRRGIRLKRVKVINRPSGKRDVYYRHPSGAFLPLPDLPENDPAFVAAYAAAAALEDVRRPGSAKEGTLAHVAIAYKSSAAWKMLAPSTRRSRGYILDKIVQKGGGVPTEQIQPRHIEKDISDCDPHAANTRLKVWRSLMKFAKTITGEDPAKLVDKVRAPIIGHHCWTDAEIEKFRAAHQTGTRARMAMELILWSGARRSDAVQLGRQNIRCGRLHYTQGKTGATVSIPILPSFAAELAALPAGQMLFMQTIRGGPHSTKAFGNWFRKACDAAKLPSRCTAHGLRKARARIMAENGATTHMIAAWTGHKTLSEVDHYSSTANRANLADDAAKLERDSTPFQKREKFQ